ncbi:tail fiber protein [Escherichia coli]|nr:tail fiber protein [Escherichia coli]
MNQKHCTATPKAVKAAYDSANGKYTAQNATTTQKGLFSSVAPRTARLKRWQRHQKLLRR